MKEKISTFDKWLWIITGTLFGFIVLGYILKASGYWGGF
jgi:hypothetical protein